MWTHLLARTVSAAVLFFPGAAWPITAECGLDDLTMAPCVVNVPGTFSEVNQDARQFRISSGLHVFTLTNPELLPEAQYYSWKEQAGCFWRTGFRVNVTGLSGPLMVTCGGGLYGCTPEEGFDVTPTEDLTCTVDVPGSPSLNFCRLSVPDSAIHDNEGGYSVFVQPAPPGAVVVPPSSVSFGDPNVPGFTGLSFTNATGAVVPPSYQQVPLASLPSPLPTTMIGVSDPAQLWEIDFLGSFEAVEITLKYKDSGFVQPFDENGLLFVAHFVEDEWQLIVPAVDATANTVTFTVDRLSPFTLVTTPPITTLPRVWLALGLISMLAVSAARSWPVWMGAEPRRYTRDRATASHSGRSGERDRVGAAGFRGHPHSR